MPSRNPEDVTILLVEDNPDDADLVRIAMDEAGVRATLDVVPGGRSCLNYLSRKGEYQDRGRPDLILLDLNLPDLDGREVLRLIKSEPRLAFIPIVVMSTSVDDNDIMATYRLQANAYLSKPPDFGELVDLVNAIQAFWLTAAHLPGR